jgi:hypothetical protein
MYYTWKCHFPEMHENLAVLNCGAIMYVGIPGIQLYVIVIVSVHATETLLYWVLVIFYLWASQKPGSTDSWCCFVFRDYRDLALLNLGAIFHQAHFPAEAAIILHAAVDHAPLMAQSHFLLGNVYAVLGDCNR